jgi:hypothetical protein
VGCNHIKPQQGYVLFDLTLSDEFSPVESYEVDFELVLRRPIEATRLIGMWLEANRTDT